MPKNVSTIPTSVDRNQGPEGEWHRDSHEPHPATSCPTFLGSSTYSMPVEASVTTRWRNWGCNRVSKGEDRGCLSWRGWGWFLRTATVCHVEADLDLSFRMSDLNSRWKLQGGSFWVLLFQIRECQEFLLSFLFLYNFERLHSVNKILAIFPIFA